ncbi:hypothetical protein RB614_12440 [Phytohabitans sp. ZYX-F-186]|uniref:Uncharacterized protein n=1 Tax=Phytohabitans maris TaxID=3071409 RepID=A0ABU0ZEE7_9ACTN|nr:hypothetical protein [Phytohabitans sp. ZYX-F-186]MDQ7905333.1 hypothetical protein [Phytohabitans sp. ZYX-F-186]
MIRVVDVTIERRADGFVAVKLQAPEWELNLRATAADLVTLEGIREADWASRRSLHVGEAAGVRVHWAADGEIATVMVGHDDETWDFAAMLPVASVEGIAAAARQSQ